MKLSALFNFSVAAISSFSLLVSSYALAASPPTWLDPVERQISRLSQQLSGVEATADALRSLNPDQVVNWVNENTVTVPYRGFLKGPAGVLADGIGNSADQSALVAELLRLQGYQVRLLIGDKVHSVETDPRKAPKTYADLRLAVGDSGGAMDTNQAQAHAQATGRARTFADKLAGELVGQVPFGSEMRRVEEGESWAVEVLWNGAWKAVSPNSAVPLDIRQRIPVDVSKPVMLSVPAQWKHNVEISVIVERDKGDGAYETFAPLQQVIEPSVTGLTPIQLTLVPEVPGLTAAIAAGSQASAKFAAIDSWQPVLQIGARVISGERFGATGTQLQSGNDSGGLFGNALSAATDALTELPGGQITAVMVRYKITQPGRPDRLETRWIYDYFGRLERQRASLPPAAPLNDAQRLDRARNLADQIRILPQTHWVDPVRVRQAFLGSLGAAAPQIAQLSEGQPMDGGAIAPAIHGLPLQLALARQEISPVAPDVFIDEVNLLTAHSQFSFSEGGNLIVRRSMDIVTNSVATLPGHKGSESENNFRQGVADTLAESLVTRGGDGGGNPAALRLLNRISAEDWALDAVPDNAELANRVDGAKRDGYRVFIAPALNGSNGSPEPGFWRIDPLTGETVGIDSRGWGATTAEYVIVTTAILMCSFVVLAGYLIGEGTVYPIFEGICADTLARSDDDESDMDNLADDPADDPSDDTATANDEDASNPDESDTSSGAEQEDASDDTGDDTANDASDESSTETAGETSGSAESENASDTSPGVPAQPGTQPTGGAGGSATDSGSSSTASFGGGGGAPTRPLVVIAGNLLNSVPEGDKPAEGTNNQPAAAETPKTLDLGSIGGIGPDGNDVEEPDDPGTDATGGAGSFDVSSLFPDRYGQQPSEESEQQTPAGMLGIHYGF